MDPVTDDLNWNMYSADLADGIVVSILDSFELELPVLDSTMVQSVLEELDKSSPKPKDGVKQSTEKYSKDILRVDQKTISKSPGKHSPRPEDKFQRSTAKGKYSKDITILTETKILKSPDKNSPQLEDQVKHGTKLGPREENTFEQSYGVDRTTDNPLVHSSPLAASSADNRRETMSLPQKQRCQSKEDTLVHITEVGRSSFNASDCSPPSAIRSMDEKVCFQDNGSLLQTQLHRSEDNSMTHTNKTRKSTDNTFKHVTSSILSVGGPKEVESATTKTKNFSTVLKTTGKTSSGETGSGAPDISAKLSHTTGKTLQEEERSSAVAVKSTENPKTTRKTSQEECTSPGNGVRTANSDTSENVGSTLCLTTDEVKNN